MAHGLGSPAARGILVPGPGIEAMPALAGRFLTTGPPGKSCPFCLSEKFLEAAR